MEQIKKPIKNGVAKVPVIMQLEALECGAACLTMILAYYNKWIPIEQVRSDCGVSRDGSNAANILRAANYYGLKTSPYKLDIDELKNIATFPCIIHWNFRHFVVLDGFRGNKAYLNDPAKGRYSVSMDDFDDAYTGVCVMFEPSDDFKPSGKNKSIVELSRKRLNGAKSAIFFTIILSFLSAIFTAVNPQFSKIFLDELLSNKTPDLVIPFFVILAVFNICQIIVTAIESIYKKRFEGKMSSIGSLSYMWKVLHLPLEFFSQRMAGDIQQRQTKNEGIANSLINTYAPLILNSIMMILYLCIMIKYSWILTLVGLSAMFINFGLTNIITNLRINVSRSILMNSAKLYSYTVAGIEQIETIKSSGSENGYFSKWSGFQASSNTDSIRILKIDSYLGLIPQFVSQLSTYIVLVLGVFLAIQGKFTLGAVMAFQGYLTAFMNPAQLLIDNSNKLQEMRTDMERIDDVMQYQDDDIFSEDYDTGDEKYSKLRGNLIIKDLSFGYSPLAEPIIKDFNLKLEPGKSVAIVGPSGCGKSTISKLIGGLYKPWDGEITFDGKKHSEIDKTIFAGSVAVVDQDILFFEGTIADNIKMWDKSIEDYEMILAAKDAQILDEINLKNGGFDHQLLNNANDFSGGQRQRMEIARVLTQDPRIIVLDEATSALDAKTEYDVIKSIQNRGIGCVVIAHRLSTIRNCDEIIVLNQGVTIGRGTHEELMQSCEMYKTLVANE